MGSQTCHVMKELALALVAILTLRPRELEEWVWLRRGRNPRAVSLFSARIGLADFGDDARTLRVVNRHITKLQDRNGVRLSSRMAQRAGWVDGTEFPSGSFLLRPI
jgi:hypothetical protein